MLMANALENACLGGNEDVMGDAGFTPDPRPAWSYPLEGGHAETSPDGSGAN